MNAGSDGPPYEHPHHTRIMEQSPYDDPSLYDRIVSPPDSSLEFYLEVIGATEGPVLELACGTGRLTIPIARALANDPSRPVTGLDLAPAMLEATRRNAAGAGLAIELVEGDMRTFSLGRRFGTIFVAFNTLLHLTTRHWASASRGCASTSRLAGRSHSTSSTRASACSPARRPNGPP